MTEEFARHPAYQEYERLQVQLHKLISAGEAESEEADAIRDEMDAPWKHLTQAEHDRLGGLSADLYMLANEEMFEKASADERNTLGMEILAAREQRDWEAVLSMLRKGPTSLSRRDVALFRAEAYDELGHPEVARLFARYAADLSADEVRHKLVHS